MRTESVPQIVISMGSRIVDVDNSTAIKGRTRATLVTSRDRPIGDIGELAGWRWRKRYVCGKVLLGDFDEILGRIT